MQYTCSIKIEIILICLGLLCSNAFSQAHFFGTRHPVKIGAYNGFCDEPPVALQDGTKPWVWYGPTIGGNPNTANGWLFEQLIKKGIWVCGLNVGESYGAPFGTQAFDEFYTKVTTDFNLWSKVMLIPQSRGGLMLYNWAAEGTNATKVSRIVGIYPVGDLQSYPGLEIAAPAYQMTTQDLTVNLAQFNPVDNLKPLADVGVKIFHLHGDADVVVPLAENSQVIYNNYKSMGGDMTLVVVPGKGHAEIPEFFQRTEMLNFILDELEANKTSLESKHVNLFNGSNLDGWHTQGDCQWSVENDYIKGIDPNGNWCHLVTDESYSDYYVTLKYKIIHGNSGLYIRTAKENSACCGIQGIQIDFGPSQDGSVMPVVDGKWFWVELTTRAVDEGIVNYADWNELAVEVSGDSIKTWINGSLMVSIDYEKNMFPTGNLALQLHSGGVGDEVHYKEIELYQPRKIEGCMDSTFKEFSPDANVSDPNLCINPITSIVKLGLDKTITLQWIGGELILKGRKNVLLADFSVFNIKGYKLPLKSTGRNRYHFNFPPGLYLVKIDGISYRIFLQNFLKKY